MLQLNLMMIGRLIPSPLLLWLRPKRTVWVEPPFLMIKKNTQAFKITEHKLKIILKNYNFIFFKKKIKIICFIFIYLLNSLFN